MVIKAGKCFFTGFLGIVALQIVLPVVFFFSTALIKQYQSEQLAHTRSDNKNLLTFNIKADDPRFVLNGENEFSFKGKLYDIKEIGFSKGFYTITAIIDEVEMGINKLSNNQNDPQSDRLDGKNFIPFFLLYFETHSRWTVSGFTDVNPPYNHYFNSLLIKIDKEIFIPPPQGSYRC